jgi:hypothetical protein
MISEEQKQLAASAFIVPREHQVPKSYWMIRVNGRFVMVRSGKFMWSKAIHAVVAMRSHLRFIAIKEGVYSKELVDECLKDGIVELVELFLSE